MANVKQFATEVAEGQESLLEALKEVEKKVEDLFELATNPEVPEELANRIRVNAEAIKTAVAKIPVDDAPEEPPVEG